jgi:hypothetical protein
MTMDKVDFVKVTDLEGVEVEHAIVEHADGSFTSMLKSTYDEQQAQAEQSTPIVINEAETI